jgi:replication factor C subunit 1
MYTIKYRPNNLSNFIGNQHVILPFIRWLLEWDNKKKDKCALVSGVSGVGKSLLVELMLKKHDYNIIHLTIDDDKDKHSITQSIKPLLKMRKTFDGQDNVLVVSDIDGNGGDHGFISTLTECIKETNIPVICICDDRYSQNIKPILNYCFDIKLLKPRYDDVYKLIYNVVTTENIKISKSSIDKLYELSNGDIRFILNTLQLDLKKGDKSKNIQNSNIFDTTAHLLSMDASLEDKFKCYWSAPDIHTLLVHENYIGNTLKSKDEIKCLENLSYSCDSLSDADIGNNMFDFELSSYVAMNTIKATTTCNKKTMIKFPQYLGKISSWNKNKREKLNYEDVKLFEKETKHKVKETKPKVKETKSKIKETKPKVKEPKPKIKETKV